MGLIKKGFKVIDDSNKVGGRLLLIFLILFSLNGQYKNAMDDVSGTVLAVGTSDAVGGSG